MPRTMHPNSLANLRPVPFTRETAPKGRKNAGLSLIEQINRMATWPQDRLEKVRDDEKAPIIERRAAERLLDPEDAWQIVNHTHGTPKQTVEAITPPEQKVIDLGEVAEQLAAMGWDPETMPPMLKAALDKRRATFVQSTVIAQSPRSDHPPLAGRANDRSVPYSKAQQP